MTMYFLPKKIAPIRRDRANEKFRPKIFHVCPVKTFPSKDYPNASVGRCWPLWFIYYTIVPLPSPTKKKERKERSVALGIGWFVFIMECIWGFNSVKSFRDHDTLTMKFSSQRAFIWRICFLLYRYTFDAYSYINDIGLNVFDPTL